MRAAASSVVLLLLATGCTTTRAFLGVERLETAEEAATVLLMPTDIVVSELTTGGLLEPRADWTADAEKQVAAALDELLQERKGQIIQYGGGEEPIASEHLQLVKLHAAVGQAILVHKYSGQTLPTKRDRFDWTLGERAQALRESSGANYALFVFFRDSFASTGRHALIFFGALIGIGIPAGSQVGFASLVDLRTGDIVWFNRLASSAGDLRKPKSAKRACQALLSKFPL